MWALLLLLAILAICALAVVRLTRRMHDETVTAVREFDELRAALNPGAEALRSEAAALGEHLERGPRPSHR